MVVLAIASSNLFQVIYKLREKKRKKKTKKKKQKMKSMNDSNTNDGNNHNWLGFSLSPHMKMDVTSSTGAPQHHHHHYYHHPQASAAAACNNNTVPTNFYMSPSNLNTSGICYGVGGNSTFHTPLAMMPLKSDGSLCIMEALTRSQTQGKVFLSSSMHSKLFLPIPFKCFFFLFFFALLFN